MITIQMFLILILAVIAGLCYRLGGSAGGQRWVREVGEGICLALGIFVLGLFNWLTPLCLGSVFIETTYFKKKGEDATWFNWMLVGLSFSVATLPWFIGNIIFKHKISIGYLIRIPVCTGLVLLWQLKISGIIAKLFGVSKDKTDEGGRGAIQILTLPLLLF